MKIIHRFEDFHQKFKDNEFCLSFLDDLKWGNGFSCKKCNNHEYRTSNSIHHRRCLSCGYEESVTANTVFHNIKFPLHKAFYLVYRIRHSDGKVTAVKLMIETLMSIHTVSKFKNRILQQLHSQNVPVKPQNLNPDNFLDELV